MSSFPQKPPANQKQMKRLLEKHNAREAYDKLAARIILANERTQDALPSRVQTGEAQRIKITERHLQEIQTGRFGRVRLPSEKEARCWLKQWREGAKSKEETPIRKIVIPRDRNEVRELQRTRSAKPHYPEPTREPTTQDPDYPPRQSART